MVSTPLRSKILSHTRSTSLPSRSHPLIPQFNDHLHRLNPASIDSSLPSIAQKLSILENVYDCVDDLLRLSHTQQVFQGKWVEEILDGYLRLVDVCATVKDFTFNARQDIQDLLSVLRRKRDADEFCKFLSSRRQAKKMIHKSLRSTVSFKNKPTIFALDKDQETVAVISMLKETEYVILDLIETLLWSIIGTKKGQKGWSLVSRLLHISGTDYKEEVLEFEELEASLFKLVNGRTSSKFESGMLIHDLRHRLSDMDLSMQVVEERLECLFKRLIKTRVSLLNIQSQYSQ